MPFLIDKMNKKLEIFKTFQKPTDKNNVESEKLIEAE